MAAVEIHRHRFTVEDFAHMGEAGVSAADDRVDLIDGEMCTAPGPDGYTEERVLRRGEEIASAAVAGLLLPIDEVFDEVFGDRS